MTGVELIAKERERQIARSGEHWTAEHDDGHDDESIACAASVYTMPARFRKTHKRGLWRWHSAYFKPTPHDRIRELEKAGALIAAEIDRLLRAQLRKQHDDHG